MQPVTNSDGQKGFYDESTGFVPLESMQKVTNDTGERGYYSDKSGFVKAPSDSPKGVIAETASDFKKRAANVGKIIASSDILPSRTLQVIGQGGGFLADATANVAKGLYEGILPADVRGFISERNKATFGSGPVPTDATSLAEVYGGVKEVIPETMRNVEAVANIAAGLPAGKALYSAGGMGVGAAKRGLNVMSPKPTPEQAMGQVLQGKTSDIAKGQKAFSAIDTKGVKTYAELGDKIDDAVSKQGKLVDMELSKDATSYPLQTLVTAEKSAGGKVVKTNYVQDALTQLQELYAKTNNAVRSVEMEELLAKAQTAGLTKKEVNDIARLYGSEYRAFNPSSGVPLTSVNAQGYENVRKGLKEVARRGLGDTAKELDETLSGLLNTRRLIDKNVEAANRLRQKIDERGLGEKVGRAVLTAIDVATLGTAKGALLKMLPRGLGYKTKNYLDLEDSLRRNLKIIENEYGRINKP